MAQTHKPPRLMFWNGDWYVFYFDRPSGKRKRALCRSLRAHTDRQREELVLRFIERDTLERRALAGLVIADNFTKPAAQAVADFRADVASRVAVREANPGTREGLSKAGGYILTRVALLFEAWLRANKPSAYSVGELDAPALKAFLATLAVENRSGATLNTYRAQLRACLHWLDARRPRLLPDAAPLFKALKAVPTIERDVIAYSPAELSSFLKRAMLEERQPPTRRIRRRGQTFRQTVAVPATPVSRLFLLLALTGMRLGEALALRWEHVDLARGRLAIYAEKTARRRYLPLLDAPEGKVAPRFVKLLRTWREEAPAAIFVLPHEGIEAPAFPKHAWERVKGEGRITPQGLRQNFTSYAASLNFPMATTAIWQGHSLEVAQRFYLQQVLERLDASSIESAMGLER